MYDDINAVVNIIRFVCTSLTVEDCFEYSAHVASMSEDEVADK